MNRTSLLVRLVFSAWLLLPALGTALVLVQPPRYAVDLRPLTKAGGTVIIDCSAPGVTCTYGGWRALQAPAI